MQVITISILLKVIPETHVRRTKLDIYVLITITGSILLLVEY